MPAALKPGTELSGRVVFGELTVLRIERDPTRGRRHYALCRCSCGAEKLIRIDHLRTGKTISCGHISRELASQRALSGPLGAARTKHGMSKSRAYSIWCGMHQRCGNPNNSAYPRYGGRGIFICERWHKFENFLDDMGEPTEDQTLDRKDNDGPYSPDNCRWATRLEQSLNKSDNRWITVHGETKPVTVWARELGLGHSTIQERLAAGIATANAVSPAMFFDRSGLALGGKANGARQRARTHCKNGHPFDEANTRFDGKQRYCRACRREAARKRYHRR